jgi:hypothetical protein
MKCAELSETEEKEKCRDYYKYKLSKVKNILFVKKKKSTRFF